MEKPLARSVRYHITLLPYMDVDDDGASINNRGQVVSDSFLWYKGHLRVLLAPKTAYAGEHTSAHGINDTGTIVGEASGDSSGAYTEFYGQAVVWHGAKGQELPGRDLGNTIAYAVNNAGVIVGQAYLFMTVQDDNTFQAFLLRHGKKVFLKARRPICINNRGQVLVDAGSSTLTSSYDAPTHFMLLSRGKRVPIKNARTGAEFGDAVAMNDAGVVVGAIGNNACLWRQGHVTKLGRLSATQVDPAAINNQGQVVGKAEIKPRKPLARDDTPETHAFLWQHGSMIDLNHLVSRKSGWVLSEAAAINDRGWIVCWGNKGACLLTPIAHAAKPR